MIRSSSKPSAAPPDTEIAAKPTRLMIADDHAIVRSGLRALLERESSLVVVAEAGSGETAVDLWHLSHPDVVLIDLKMPNGDGIWAIRSIRAVDPNALFIILTTFEGDEAASQGLKAGARGYLLKDATPAELIAAIREVAAGGSYVSPEVARQLALRAHTEKLTRRELDVLAELARGSTNKLIAETLGIVEGTVKLHMRSILAKLGATSRSEALAIATRRGFMHSE